MSLPRTNHLPPFNVTRASHLVLGVRDLSASLAFYEEIVGLVVSDRDGDMAFLRGIEEDSHHSLTLVRRDGEPRCEQLGFRVYDDDDLDKAAEFFAEEGIAAVWAEVPFQRKTLRVRDPFGVPLEFCSSMPVLPRLHSRTAEHKGGAALRFDHTQVQVPDVYKGCSFYTGLGFRVSDYAVTPAGDLVAVFQHRKNNPHDLVLGLRKGPRLHHFGYIVDKQNLLRAGDVASSLGYRQNVEYGPSRHGQDHASFVYMRDPDGHRIELLSHPIQIVDLDSAPIRRDVTDRDQFVPWGPPPPKPYVEEATEFPGAAVSEPVIERTW